MSENFYSGFEAILKTYERKLKECPKGVRLHQKINKNKNGKRNFYLSLQFKDPGTDKRSPKSCGEDFTEDGIIRAVEKAKLVDAKLRESNLSVSDFWEWYEAEIKQKCKFEDDRITYREIFADMKRKYYAGKHKFSKIPRREGSDSFDASYEKCYLKYFNKFPNWDKYPEYDDFLKVIDHWPSGTYTHNAAISKCKDIAKYISNNDKIIKKLDSLYTVKTVYRKSESCSIEDYLLWYKEVKLSIPNLPKKQGDARDKTLWATAMMVAYGLRPHELTAIENLDKPVVKNETIIPALSDINNTDYLLVIGDVGYDGTTTKTGSRVTIPLIKDLELLEFLNLRMPKLHIYKPQQESLASSKIRGFGFNLAKNLKKYKCPTKQLYAFRHLANQLGEKYGIPQETRCRILGHNVHTNEIIYKSRDNIKTTFDLLTNHAKHPLDYETTKSQLSSLGIDLSEPCVQLILRVIYQLND